MVSDAQLAQAAAWQQVGRLKEALAVYQQHLAQHPDDPRVLAMLGVLRLQQGLHDRAIDALRRAHSIAPDNDEIAAHLSSALIAGTRLDRARDLFTAMLQRNPGSLNALAGLTHVLTELGDLAGAIEQCQTLIRFHPAVEAGYQSLARLHLEHGDLAAAQQVAGQLLERKPQHPDAGLVLIQAKAQGGELTAAMRQLDDLLARHANFTQAWLVKAQLCRDQHDLEQASQCVDQAVRLEPGLEPALILRIELLQQRGHSETALAACADALGKLQRSAGLHFAHARVLEDLGKMPAAQQAYRQALALGGKVVPGAQAWGQAAILEALQRFEDSAESRTQDEQHINQLLQQSNLADLPRARLLFARGKIEHDRGQTQAAFAAYKQANELMSGLRPYDSQQQRAYAEELKAILDPDTLARIQACGHQSDQPIFVVGLPRSGSTLVEQVLASHPQVFGAGESDAFTRTIKQARTLTGQAYPRCIASLGQAEWQELAQTYLTAINANAQEQYPRVTDKRLANSWQLGLLLSLFPRAKAVYCDRHPADTALSMYFQNFSEGQAFSYALEDIARHQALEADLIAHWRELFGARIATVTYEKLVADFEAQARALLAALDLPWDDQCLEFHRAQRVVQTASAHQVRQPVHQQSVQRWRRYAEAFEPYLVAARELGVIDS